MHRTEQVGVIPRAIAASLGVLEHGFNPLTSLEQLEALERALVYTERAGAEEDPSHKQIIPYGVVRRAGTVFTVERLRGGGERRLHGKISIGIGGHIDPRDGAAGRGGPIRSTLARELAEELDASGLGVGRPIGFINDDTQPVGRVHLGVVYLVDLGPGGRASVRELGSLRGGFLPWATLRPLRPSMETWSTFVHDAHEAGLLA
jgi:predicted NUDIX family phosphoesterase